MIGRALVWVLLASSILFPGGATVLVLTGVSQPRPVQAIWTVTAGAALASFWWVVRDHRARRAIIHDQAATIQSYQEIVRIQENMINVRLAQDHPERN